MAAASPAPAPTATAGVADSAATGLGRAIERTLGLAKSWVGLLTAYVVAVTAAVYAFQKFAEPLKGRSFWILVSLLAAPLVLALVFQAIPELFDRRRRKRLTEITGHLTAGYFQLAPRQDEASFSRADGKHEEILRWIESPLKNLKNLPQPRLHAGERCVAAEGQQEPANNRAIAVGVKQWSPDSRLDVFSTIGSY